MARYGYLVFLSTLILASCAQVGTISGGDTDSSAPKPIADKVAPPNASVNFSGNTVVIPFDEYFTLSSPTTSIQMVPPHATINASYKQKTLTLTWEEELQENTTYAIYLNNTVRDLSERNDSIMQYVFSTGNTLDSTSYSVSVVDAFTNAPSPESVVALYDQHTNGLINFAQTDRSGQANLTYLRPGTYKIVAFKDENSDLLPQENEEVGFFKDSLITIDSTTTNPDPIRLFAPAPKPEIVEAKFQGPASFVIESNVKIEDPSVSMDGVAINSDRYFYQEDNKLQVFVDPTNLTSGEIVLTTSSFSDTATYRVLDAQKQGTVHVTSSQKKNAFSPDQPFAFNVNDIIESIDTSLIHITRIEDSTLVPAAISFAGNVITFDVPRGSSEEVRVEFEKDAITTLSGKSLSFNGVMKLNSSKKYGILSVDVSSYENAIILQVMKGTDVVRELFLEPSSERVMIKELNPGDYTFKIVRDDNKNQKWDTGDLNTRTLPEQIDQYSQATTVRANWEVEVELVPIELKE